MPRRLRVYLLVCLGSFVAAFIVQTVFQSLGENRSHWGGSPGWQREIAFWNIFAITVLVQVLRTKTAAFAQAVAQGCVVLFFLLGTNHLFAFMSAPAASFHWPPLVLNYAGFAFGAHTLLTLRHR
jgi:hypothetical protein